MTRIGISAIAVLALTVQPSSAVPPWSRPDLEMYFRQDIGLNEDQIAAIRSGLPVATALELLLAYQSEGNTALGNYDDKRDPTAVPEQFAYLLSYCRSLSEREPDLYHYLLAYPRAKPASYEDTFYWAKVKFGLKPTLRIVHMVTMRGGPSDPVANAIAGKQLYSTHYFEAGLELSVCVREGYAPKRDGFYLIQAMGSEQAGLSGLKGSIVRKAAVDRAVSNLQKGLKTIKSNLEGSP